MGHNDRELVFALPPSMGLASIRPIARELADLLSGVGFSTIWPTRSYAQLEAALASGEAHAAWAPPGVCARAEALGGDILFRAVRGGATAYRAALLCRGERSIDLKRLDAMSGIAPIRAAWVDPHSLAGYVMPRHYLRERGADLQETFDETVLGSYQACFDAVLEGDADLTASYVGRRGSGYIDLLGNAAAELRVLAWTDEIPNDGVVVSPALDPALGRDVGDALSAAFRNIRLADKLALAFDADGFDLPAPGTYAELLPLMEPEADDTAELDQVDRPRRIAGRGRRHRSLLRLGLEPAFG